MQESLVHFISLDILVLWANRYSQFNGNKTLTCGGGGMIITNSKKIAKKLKHLSTHAKVASRPDHYHDEIGYNYRMTNISAAVGCGQLSKINKTLKSKRQNFDWYKKILGISKV